MLRIISEISQFLSGSPISAEQDQDDERIYTYPVLRFVFQGSVISFTHEFYSKKSGKAFFRAIIRLSPFSFSERVGRYSLTLTELSKSGHKGKTISEAYCNDLPEGIGNLLFDWKRKRANY